MKKLLAGLLLAASLFLTDSAKAAAGCGLTLFSNPKVTAQYGITITVFGQTTYQTIAPGANTAVSLSDGDLVLVQASNYICGSLSSLNWGFTSWTHCSQSDAPGPVVMGGDFTMDWYVAREACMCPAPGYGMLVDTYSGYQCQGNPPPQQ
jgi:hypothetical protein